MKSGWTKPLLVIETKIYENKENDKPNIEYSGNVICVLNKSKEATENNVILDICLEHLLQKE